VESPGFSLADELSTARERGNEYIEIPKTRRQALTKLWVRSGMSTSKFEFCCGESFFFFCVALCIKNRSFRGEVSFLAFSVSSVKSAVILSFLAFSAFFGVQYFKTHHFQNYVCLVFSAIFASLWLKFFPLLRGFFHFSSPFAPFPHVKVSVLTLCLWLRLWCVTP